MKTLVIFIGVTLTACTSAPPAPDHLPSLHQTAVFSPDNEGIFGEKGFFGVTVLAEGDVAVSEDAISIDLSHTSFISSPKYNKSQYVESYAVCLGGGEYGGKWKLIKCSQPASANVTIPYGGTQSIPNRSFSIDTKGIMSLDGAWLFLQLTRPTDNTTLYMFTHSQRDVFGNVQR